MAENKKKVIFIVDDEPAVHRQMAKTLAHLKAEVVCFDRAAHCLERISSGGCDLVITDVKMPDMDGVEFLARVKDIVPSLPVLIITGYGDVSMAVNALKAGAADVIERPVRTEVLLSAVKRALKVCPDSHIRIGSILTKTEREVLQLILKGKATKEIAAARNRSPRTVESHRNRIHRKLGVRNLMELFNRLGESGCTRLLDRL